MIYRGSFKLITLAISPIEKFIIPSLNVTRDRIQKKTYRKFTRSVDIEIGSGTGPGCDEQQSKLAPCDQNQRPQYEPTVSVAYDGEVPPDPKVLRQH